MRTARLTTVSFWMLLWCSIIEFGFVQRTPPCHSVIFAVLNARHSVTITVLVHHEFLHCVNLALMLEDSRLMWPLIDEQMYCSLCHSCVPAICGPCRALFLAAAQRDWRVRRLGVEFCGTQGGHHFGDSVDGPVDTALGPNTRTPWGSSMFVFG